MPTSTKAIALLFCVLSFLVALGTMFVLAYNWSFTETTFGGYAGVVLPIAICVYCFLVGLYTNKIIEIANEYVY